MSGSAGNSAVKVDSNFKRAMPIPTEGGVDEEDEDDEVAAVIVVRQDERDAKAEEGDAEVRDMRAWNELRKGMPVNEAKQKGD